VRTSGVETTTVVVPPLTREHLTAFVKDALLCDDAHAATVAAVVASRSGGNPFFARSILQSLAETGALRRDETGGWRIALDEIGQREANDHDVVELVVARLDRLPRATREVLRVAACLGSELHLRDLALATGSDEEAAAAAIRAAIDASLVLRGPSTFRFVHDRVQEAAYSSMPDSERTALHLAIGRRLIADARTLGDGEPLSRAVEQRWSPTPASVSSSRV
jgi:predicted ATPase